MRCWSSTRTRVWCRPIVSPRKVLASVASLTTLLRSVFSDHIDRAEIGRELAAYWAAVLERFHQERQRHPPERFCDVTFAQLRDASDRR